jgi:hypothetical protein
LKKNGVLGACSRTFAQELAGVIRRFLKLKEWRGTERIVIGGGLSESRVGELAIQRAAVVLGAEGEDVTLRPVRNPPDEAGLISAAHLYPSRPERSAVHARRRAMGRADHRHRTRQCPVHQPAHQ